MGKWIALLFGAAGLAYLASKAAAGEQLKYFPSGLKLTGGLSNPKLFLQMDVVNARNTSLDVNAFFASIYAGEQIIGRVDYPNKIFIPKLETTKLNIPVKLFGLGAVKLLIQMASGSVPKKFKVAGSASSPLGVVKFEEPISLTQ